jgi:PAB-dependent poly(A)-specific ribonuclease subunit 2
MAASEWDEIARVAVPPSVLTGLHNIPSAATAVIFDDSQELVWIATNDGRIISHHGPELRKYTSVRAHINEGKVHQLLSHERGIISISSTSINLVSRRGPGIWNIAHSQMTGLRCMCLGQTSNHLLVAGSQSLLFVIDIEKGAIISQHPSRTHYTILKRGRHICAATKNGEIDILSLSDCSVLATWKAHNNRVNDMDIKDDYLVTCGFSLRHTGQLQAVVDPMAKVYDLKHFAARAPIPFQAGAANVRLHPKLQTTSFIVSQTGQMQIVDILSPLTVTLKAANVQFVLNLEISSSGDALLFNDSSGFVYVWGRFTGARFNAMSKDTELAGPTSSSVPHVDWVDSPLNSVGLPFYSDALLSAWPTQLLHEVGAPAAPIDPSVMAYLQPSEFGHFAPNVARKGRRYQTENTRLGVLPATIAAPKFLSEKAREAAHEGDTATISTVEALNGLSIPGRTQTEEERMLKYNKVEIKYSRFGVDDFDFSFFNKTQYSGLETHIANSYINSLVQLYKFVPLLRNVAIQHAATQCIYASCFLCEFGFLFDMLEKADGQNCQATNLLRAFGACREASTLNLFENAATAAGVSLSALVQSVNRFFLRRIAEDYERFTGDRDGIDELLSTNSVELIRCTQCNSDTVKPSKTYLHDLNYLPIEIKHHRPHMYRFAQVLRNSIERETKSRAWCLRCRRYQQLAIRKNVNRLPFVLMLNTMILNPAARQIWEAPGWLPQEIGIQTGERVQCYEGSDLQLHIRNKTPNVMVYELVGYVADVDTDDRQSPHLVSMLNTEVSSKKGPVNLTQKCFPNWHLFNDFLVDKVDPREALHFNKSWKMPAVICYQIKTAHGKVDDGWRSSLDTSLLYGSYSINGIAPSGKCHILQHTESPRPGTHIALDTEFVELEKAEINVKADGTHETIRPAKNGLARVSVLRGDGAGEGVTFIDDYIQILEPIVDYKTQYSGIKPGDLEASISQHNLVPLKVAYKKLWILLNLGCIFVGHGLASDFRKANIHVPKGQTVDTQWLYLAAGKNRRLSLRYLAWAVFGEYIQEEMLDDSQNDGHDSIEDAHMALRLWRRFQEYEEKGDQEQMIEEIYRKGSRFGWKPPLRSGERSLLAEGGGNSAFASGRNTPEANGYGMPGTPGTGPRISNNGMLSPYRNGNLGTENGGSSNGIGLGGPRLGESPLR